MDGDKKTLTGENLESHQNYYISNRILFNKLDVPSKFPDSLSIESVTELKLPKRIILPEEGYKLCKKLDPLTHVIWGIYVHYLVAVNIQGNHSAQNFTNFVWYNTQQMLTLTRGEVSKN